ncbi:hypothetical protein IIB97_02150 [Patescibacteria group bacterium]|nr:hypothetical protein [Patescibacteria group bacterium]
MSSGPVVDEQLEALGAFGKNPADKADEKDSLDEVFEAAKSSEVVKEKVENVVEEEEEEAEEEEITEDKEELEEPTPSSDEEEEDEPDEEPSEEETVEEPSELETLKIQNAKLMEILNSNAALQESVPAEKPPEQPQPPQQAEPQRIPLTIPKLPEVDATELDAIISDPAKFNDHMKKVFDAGQQSMYSMLPRVVSNQVETQMVMDRFFVENKDLVAMSQYVKQAAMEIQTLDPSASAAVALEKAGDKIRGALGIVKRSEIKEGRKQKVKKRSPRRFAPATSKREGPTKSSRSKKAKEVDPDSFEAQFNWRRLEILARDFRS